MIYDQMFVLKQRQTVKSQSNRHRDTSLNRFYCYRQCPLFYNELRIIGLGSISTYKLILSTKRIVYKNKYCNSTIVTVKTEFK